MSALPVVADIWPVFVGVIMLVVTENALGHHCFRGQGEGSV
jgi:hypothetical protein